MRVRYSIDTHAQCWHRKQRVLDWLKNEHLDCSVTAVEWDTDHPHDVTVYVVDSDGSFLREITAPETPRPHTATRPFPGFGLPVQIAPAH